MEKLLKLLLYAIIFVLPFGVVFRLPLQNNIAISVLDILVLLFDLIGVFVYKKSLFKNKKTFLRAHVMFIFACILGYIFVPSLSREQVLTSILYLVRFVAYTFMIFPLAQSLRGNSRLYLTSLAGAGFVFAVFGLFQYFLYPNLMNLRYLGWDDHLYRVFSTFFDPNFAGAFLGLVLLLFAYLLVSSKKFNRENIFILIGFLTTSFAFFLTYSRSSYVSFIFSVLFFLVLSKKKKFVILTIMVFVLGLYFIPKNLKSEGVHLFRTASIVARSTEYTKSIQIFLENPTTGTGFNTYRYVQQKIGFIKNENNKSHSDAGLPNSFLLVLATTGIIGFLSFTYLLFGLFKLASGIRKKNIYLYALLISSLALVLVDSMFENAFFYPFILIWVTLLLGIGLSEKKSKDI